jgi:hypothetical protein
MSLLRLAFGVTCLAGMSGCASKAPDFPAVMVPKAGVGSIVTPWSSPKKTTWLCATKEDVVVSTAPMTASSAQSKTTAADLGLKIASWISASGKYKGVENVTVTLDGGTLESAPLAELVVRFERLPTGCQDAIRMQEDGGAKYFRITTKIFRGDIVAEVSISSSLTVEAKSDALKNLQSDFGGSLSSTDSSKVTMAVKGGIWILESEPYTVPGPNEIPSPPPNVGGLARDVEALRKEVGVLSHRLESSAPARPAPAPTVPPVVTPGVPAGS